MRKFTPTPALGVACLALFVALGGGAYAATKINGANITKGSIAPSKIKNRSLAGPQIRPNGIGGPSIKESTLGEVPKAKAAQTATTATNATNATNAKNATELNGLAASKYQRYGGPIPAGTTVSGVFNCTNAASVDVCSETVTLPSPAPTGLVDATVNFAPGGPVGFTAGDADATCTGNANTPTAPVGKVCLYVATTGADAVTGTGNAIAGAIGTLGFEVDVVPAAANPVDVVGVWAYTAP